MRTAPRPPDGNCRVKILEGNMDIMRDLYKARYCMNKAKGYLPNGVPACYIHLRWPEMSMMKTEKRDRRHGST